MSTYDDQQIIDRILSGNANSFALLVDRYKDLVFLLALRMMKNREEAEEVAQDTFLKTYKSLNKFKGESKFSTWIYKIGYNTCLDRLKKSKKEQHLVRIDQFTVNQIKTLDSALEYMELEERRKVIQDCLDLLPSEDSFLLTLFYYDGRSSEEISKIVDLTTTNVKVRLFRSRKKLATILKNRLEPEIIENYER
ncbi:sigma-70 family RNA polymerase sigma factor [Arenibacter sp. F20364]|uniref:RNA polymerase sigma factor n=1 Tax=Arenibacter sp. F20364 TaxID=2926415 RepID=UPI001FF67C23|nr:sigma-70 family RNA polymerase sigma factor [Arenibacter sp. F20364]MCK0192268.1 sigma-70 family RNA polymerase sigma factor [Arenibacter sp. F20364]